MTLIEYSLILTYAQRLQRLQDSLDVLAELRAAKSRLRHCLVNGRESWAWPSNDWGAQCVVLHTFPRWTPA